MIRNFLRELRTQRWDDHRYYHHSRINQSLHFVSAASFLFAYAMLFFDPVVSALVGWLVSMTTRQAGHFFFEPRGYDHVNDATHEHKEEIKVGYNLQRTLPGEYYHWHVDSGPGAFSDRQLVAIWYLNDVPGPGGETEFPLQGVLIRPAQGKLVLFPPFWTHPHRAVTVEHGVKYIATTWVCFA